MGGGPGANPAYTYCGTVHLQAKPFGYRVDLRVGAPPRRRRPTPIGFSPGVFGMFCPAGFAPTF